MRKEVHVVIELVTNVSLGVPRQKVVGGEFSTGNLTILDVYRFLSQRDRCTMAVKPSREFGRSIF